MLLILLLAVQAAAQQPASSDFAEGNKLFAAQKFQEALAAYDRAAAAEPRRADIQLARCRTLAGLRQFEDALQACTHSLELQPNSAEALRDRGHYELNSGFNVDAQIDLEKAETLAPNDRAIHYHLGLAYYFKGEFTRAAAEFQGCLKTSKDKAEQIECEAWLYPSLYRAGAIAEAKKLLAGIAPDPSITGHPSMYLDRLLLFKGIKTEEQVAPTMNTEGALSLETVGYGIGLWHMFNGRYGKARDYFQKVIAANFPPAWGYRAAEAELRRMAQ